MATTKKDPVLVILQLTGANDYLNTIVPYTNGLYWDNRPKVNIPEDLVVPIDDELAFRSDMDSFKGLYDQGKLAIINGIGFEGSPRSHFRAMDIWHTCEPDKIGIDGWVAKVIRDLDPGGENVLKGVNFGQGLPRAMTMRGVSVTSVNHLATYGVFSSVRSSEQERAQLLDSFARMYAPAIGTGPTMEYLGQTGLDALKGADIIKVAPELYSSTVEYGNTAISTALKDVAQVHLAGLGTQVFYTSYGAIKEIEVTPDAPVVVDNGHLVAFTEGVSYGPAPSGGLKTTIFGGEGIILQLTGSGTIWIQTRNMGALAGKLMPFLPDSSN